MKIKTSYTGIFQTKGPRWKPPIWGNLRQIDTTYKSNETKQKKQEFFKPSCKDLNLISFEAHSQIHNIENYNDFSKCN